MRVREREEEGQCPIIFIFFIFILFHNCFLFIYIGKPVLDWGTRKRIALGAARGLLYLHEQCDPKIIHRDVKAANILLDDYCEAVVGDFGLAKLLDHEDSHVTTAVRGTVGHIAPEYLSTGQSSEKTDVFGFGILLLELITGQRALEFGKAANQKGAMLDWVSTISLSILITHVCLNNQYYGKRVYRPFRAKNDFLKATLNRYLKHIYDYRQSRVLLDGSRVLGLYKILIIFIQNYTEAFVRFSRIRKSDVDDKRIGRIKFL